MNFDFGVDMTPLSSETVIKVVYAENIQRAAKTV